MSTPIGWLDAGAGVAGDMLLGAALDAGADLDRVRHAINAVAPELDVRVERTQRHQIDAIKATVLDRRTGRAADADEPGAARHDHDHPHDPEQAPDHAHPHEHGPHRSWRDVRRLLDAAGLPAPVHDRAVSAFARLARAEGAVHRTAPEDVTFHEVGALDAIGEVVGVAAALHDLGLSGFTCSPVVVGSGEQVLGQHGRIPIPGPAVVHLLREAGTVMVGGPVPMEMTTPTGAALVAEYATGCGPAPAMVITAAGVGAGSRDPARLANVTRLVVGTAAHSASATASVPSDRAATEDAVVLAANVDDLDPRIWPDVLAALIAAGAADAWLTPILMKKGRPAHELSVLAPPADALALLEIIVAQTSTLGVRVTPCDKIVLHRSMEEVEVAGCSVSVKIARWGEKVVNAQPEYADVQRLAEATGVPVKVALARAVQAAADHYR